MRIPRYWAQGSCTGADRKGRKLSFSAWGWSFESLSGAQDNAAARAKRILDHVTGGNRPDGYDYLELPLREEIVDAVSVDGREIALVTRNRYGSLILNSASVLFADIDFPGYKPTGLLDAVLLAFSRSRREERAQAAEASAFQIVRDWIDRHRDRSLRLYRTRAGLRLLFTDRLYEPNSDETASMLQAMHSDPLYRRLTEKQECFRARLTPKPWRCGCPNPPSRYPWPDSDTESTYRKWEHRYAQKTQGYKTCELLEVIGEASRIDEINTIVELHDRYTCDGEQTKLA